MSTVVRRTALGPLLALVAACAAAPPPPPPAPALPPTHHVSGREAVELVVRGALLIDVSPRLLYYRRHIEGAYNLPLAELRERYHDLPRDRALVLYSLDGDHTPEADLLLRGAGYEVHVMGPMSEWHLRDPAARAELLRRRDVARRLASPLR